MPEQQARRVPGTDTPLEAITLGTSGLGGEPGGERLAAALVSGRFRQLDTSNEYAGGRSETLIGQVLGTAGEVTVFSKADRDPDTGVFDGDRVMRSFEETLSRLGVATLPFYHLHDPFTITVREAMAPGGAVPALVSLREQGLVGAIGIAAAGGTLVEDYIRTDAFDAVLTHNRYTLVDRGAEDILRMAAERRMTVFNAAPFGGGILSGSPRHASRYGYRPISPEFGRHVERVRELCDRWEIALPAAALHFSLREPRVHSTVVGISSVERLEALDALVDAVIPDGFWDDLRALGAPPPSPVD
ncbi:aldo/keto reductase [Nonomuraea rubra]|uniref:D-threo-aldose 1-dehydrogenase n=1 Tax=Nonomuraea rubra TaxID=46180 RepID=A0A7X0U0S5_9ACTN|nr:aldo/keto reductase [Nonomuraea rubra]MBB6550665.1 D-threo-aldose 1-dehydrogenase [Nonomuraea rubra]